MRHALRASDAELWMSRVREALNKNREDGRLPRTIADLATRLGRNLAGVMHILHGQTGASLDDLRRLASILKIPLKKFFCDERTRLTRATAFLCGKETTRDDSGAMAYVVYMEVHPVAENSDLETRYVQQVFKTVHGFKDIAELKSSIEKVARCLEPELKKAYDNLLRKRER